MTTKRIGPRMAAVARTVARHPGCPKLLPARTVGPNGSLRYGYASVDRATHAGLVRAERRSSGTYALYPV